MSVARPLAAMTLGAAVLAAAGCEKPLKAPVERAACWHMPR